MKTIKIILSAIVAMLTVGVTSAQAARMTSVKLTQDNPTQNTGSVHKYNFTLPSAAAIHTIRFNYCTRASTDTEGTVDGCDVPEGLSTASVTTGTAGDWTPSEFNDVEVWTPDGSTGGTVIFTASADYTPGATNLAHSLSIGGLNNAKIDASVDDKQCVIPGPGSVAANAALANTASSATCYVRMATYSVTPGLIDSGYTTYTVSAAVQVSATVDPTFTFVVQGVNSNVTTNTTGGNLVTSVSSAYNTLPFGNLTANTPKFAAHHLYVTTNTGAGYAVSARLTSLITGVYSGDNVDDFPGVWGTGGSTWYRPTGTTPNTETAWFGASTTDNSVSGGAPTGINFGGIESTAVTVKDLAIADDGTNGTYVTYQMEANVFQPSDTYNGVLIYNAIPTY